MFATFSSLHSKDRVIRRAVTFETVSELHVHSAARAAREEQAYEILTKVKLRYLVQVYRVSFIDGYGENECVL